jgi:hypothetical protein
MTEGDKSNRIDSVSDHIRCLRGGLTRPQREHRGEEPARRESNAHWRLRGPPSCPVDHGPRDALRSRTGQSGGFADRLPRRRVVRHGVPGPTRTGGLLFRKQPRFPAAPRGLGCHGISGPPGRAATGDGGRGTSSHRRRPGDMRARGGTRTPNDRTADGFTGRCAASCATLAWVADADRTRSLRDHGPALCLVELRPPCSAKESNLYRLAGVNRALSH